MVEILYFILFGVRTLDYHSCDEINSFKKVKLLAFSETCGCEDETESLVLSTKSESFMHVFLFPCAQMIDRPVSA